MLNDGEHCIRCHCLFLYREPIGSSANARGPEHADPVDCVFALQRSATAARSSWAEEKRQLESLFSDATAEVQRWKSRVIPSGAEVCDAGVTARAAHAWMIKRAQTPGSNLLLKISIRSDYTVWSAVDDDDTTFHASEIDGPHDIAKLIEFAHDVTGIDQWTIIDEMVAQP